MPPWSAAPLSLGLCLLALAVHTRLRGFLPEDPPGPRKQHDRPRPLLGAVPALAMLAACWACGAPPAMLLGLLLVTLAGFLDDARKAAGGLAWPVRLAAQAAAAALLAGHLAAGHDVLVLAALGLLAVVLINAVNFLDNCDGVAVAVVATPLLLATTGTGWSAAGAFALLGFLPLNWPRPRAFLGDAGAYAAGHLLAATVLAWPDQGAGRLAPLALAVVPLLDFHQVVLARVWLGIRPWVADRRHLTHIAMNLGLPAAWVAPAFALLAALGLLGVRALA